MKYPIYLSACLVACGLLSCQQDELMPEQVQPEPVSTQETASQEVYYNDVIRLKLSEDMARSLVADASKGEALRSTHADLQDFLLSVGAKSIERVFPPAGVFEERTRREGLHLWYDLRLEALEGDSPAVHAQRAAELARRLSGVSVVERVRREVLPPMHFDTDVRLDGLRTAGGGGLPFNDPQLPLQWHYNNTGEFVNAHRGADINLFKAWEIETGKPNVIVCVVDGGIDYAHEDLRESMWVNTRERDGQAGVDDDGNGYVDDVYGYNFCTNKGAITAEGHGTHVAGTVAARNGNGVGVSGVAGGDGSPASGVRLQSAQIFEHYIDNGKEKERKGDAAKAIKYGADNGAVICQNSWGYGYPGGVLPRSVKEAIDYFIKHAGCDNAGKQLPHSPMKGGVVIFAAGNDNQDFMAYPAAYDAVISVSSMAPDYRMAEYSNRGAWVNVMAPGGTRFFDRGRVLSTYPNNRYAYEQGTSMACPHVSGIAALVVSKFGGQGFTNQMLKDRLLTALKPERIDEYNPNYSGRLGAGYIDAEKALATNRNQKPQAPQLTARSGFSSNILVWQAVTDADDGSASLYQCYHSTSPLNEANYRTAQRIDIPTRGAKAGDALEWVHEPLTAGQRYYYALVAVDRWGLSSEPSFANALVSTNAVPRLSWSPEPTVVMTVGEEAELFLSVVEPEQQAWSFAHDGDPQLVTATQEARGVRFVLEPNDVGNHTIHITVTDALGATARTELSCVAYPNHAPEQKKAVDLAVAVGEEKRIKLSDYFVDKDGQQLLYGLRNFEDEVADLKVEGEILVIKGKRLGTIESELTVEDVTGEGFRTKVKVQVVRPGKVQMVYPTPATKQLNIRLKEGIRQAECVVRTPTGQELIRQTLQAKDGLISLNILKLSKGSYILEVILSGEVYSQAFSKY